ncbi:haloacid dehalogenase type II [Alkalicoccus urumqiensis]|uniref:Haloacid dehalogenase type II n=1 Tax=Alkalicoccus urumqiensis TaxID=1548213 RepID=A0A2P6MIC9_ALKUR|nr:haloacid dehalogenase type II [Alkalicoccus urumqiensis]PRO66042.1 haloacid dehalogenase type II [Alkalicoccus urumqiensis]
MYSAIIYDAYGTLYDVTSTNKTLREISPENAADIGALWRKKQLEYAFLRQKTGTYEPFSRVTRDALLYASTVYGEPFSEEELARCMAAYEKLDLFPESVDVLKKQTHTKNVILSNGSPDMLHPLIDGSDAAPYLNDVWSIDAVKQYKPAPAAYHLALSRLQLPRTDILFISSNPWDIIGSKSFGFDTLWINRGGIPFESGHVLPDYTAGSLTGLLDVQPPQ